MKEFTHTEAFAEGFLACGITTTGAKVKVPILECRAGVVGPRGGRPGYATFFGIGMEKNISGKNPLIFLHEIEKKTPGFFLDKLTDDSVRFRCGVLYADRGAQRTLEGFYGSLWKYLQDRRLTISVVPAPSPQDFAYGVALIQEALATETLQFPERETILRNDLKKLTIENFNNDESPTFNAFRFLLAGFQKYPEPQRSAFAWGGFKIHKNLDRKDPIGWT